MYCLFTTYYIYVCIRVKLDYKDQSDHQVQQEDEVSVVFLENEGQMDPLGPLEEEENLE